MNRRTFALATAGITIAIKPLSALSNEVEKVDVNDPAAVALGYVADAADVDQEKFSRFEASQNCANCQLYQSTDDDEWAPCAIFANKAVAAAGWCNAWIPKVG